MKLEAKLTETSQRFSPTFKAVHDISDGGFERGYTAGEEAMCEELLGGEW